MTSRTSLSQWVKQTRGSPEYAAEQAKLDFAVALDRRMLQLKVNRAELARRLGTSAAAVTMALRGDANLTLDRMARMAHALEALVNVHVAPQTASVKWFELHDGATDEQLANAATWARMKSEEQNGRPVSTAA
jgi:transcriptional regulator with XRE-family HTH domain